MIEIGIVEKNIGNLSRIVIDVPASCDKCEHCVLNTESSRHIIAVNKPSAKEGEKVKVFLNENILFASFLFYFIPLLALIGFIGAGIYLNINELYSGIIGIVGMVGSYFAIKLFSKYIKVKNYIIEVIE